MNAYVISISDPQATLENVGGKGMSLAKMINTGFPVPKGFHITTEAYRQFVAANNLQTKILTALKDVDTTLPASLETASTTIGRLFAEASTSTDIATAITTAYTELNRQSVAVRSSATAEDLPEASFAGQQETFLNIRGEADLLDAVKKCWTSLWTARAIAYRIKNNIDQNTVALAVVVQEMVDAEAAGILFTANPINGKRGEMVINAAWGLGEAIVGGLVSPDTIVAEKATGKVKSYEVAEKTVITVRTEKGTSEEPLNDARRSSKVMNEADVVELVNIARKIESYYGSPQDIEWCLTSSPTPSRSTPVGLLKEEGRKFFIVQSRPITALPPEPVQWLPPNPKGMYARGSLCEHLPNPVSPLFGTLGLRMVNIPTAELGESALGIGGRDGYQYQAINGYAYLGMVLTMKEWISMAKASGKLIGPMFKTSHEHWQTGREEFVPIVNSWKAKDVTSLSPSELLDGARQLIKAIGKFYTVVQSSTLPAASSSEIVFTRVYKLISRKDDPKAETLLFGLNTQPLRAEKSLYDLGSWTRNHSALRGFTLHASTEKLVTALQAESTPEAIPAEDWSEFKNRFETYLEEFGQTTYEFDFMNPTPAETPAVILDALKLYVEGKGSDPYARQKEADQLREETLEKIRSRFKLIPNRWFEKSFHWAARVGPDREDSIADLGMGHTTVRRYLGELGKRFTADGAIKNAEEIYWLVEDEVSQLASLLEKNETLPDHSARVPKRKADWNEQKKLIPPAMLPEKSFWAKMMPWNREDTTSNVLKGVASSAGVVTGTARVMFGPEDFHKMKHGDVLVAVTTTPAWTPLFTMASAIVADLGGPLSHSSIVAREYGIPAVVSTGLATRRIRSGQVITVDGTKGEVILEIGEEDQPAVATPTKWPVPVKGGTLARGSLAEHTPSPVSPLFATLGLRIANIETERLWKGFMGIEDPTEMFVGKGFYMAVNKYVYGGFRMNMKNAWALVKMSLSTMGVIMREAANRWQEAREQLAAVVNEWERKDVQSYSSAELLDGACKVFTAEVKYYTVIQTTLPAASMGEIFFTRFYNSLVKRRDEPQATTFLFGFENMPAKAEESLFDIATWLKINPVLADYTLRTPTESLVADFKHETLPAGIPANLWAEYRSHFDTHFDKFGRTAYEFDFVNPTPAEAPCPQFEAIKLFIEGKAESPYQRLETARGKREHATRSVLERIGWPRKSWFENLLKKAQETGVIREDSIFDMGMGHPVIRRMFAELGQRFVAGGAIQTSDDIYWLEEDEVTELIAALENAQPLPSFAERVPVRRAEWSAALQIVPPVMLPEKSFWQKFIGGGAPKEKDGKVTLTGLGTSSGTVTAPACVLFSPEDFSKMKPGDVLVATTTTPAWTPLFAMASAVVTDIGGPLSHSSIVAREYGIPAVMAARNATRHIHSGQMVTVNGKEGTVILDNHK